LYLTNPELIKAGEIFGKDIYAYEIDDISGHIDIDGPIDFEMAEFVYEKYRGKYI
jgi:hypothetical protein